MRVVDVFQLELTDTPTAAILLLQRNTVRVLLTMCNGEVGNFIMTKNWPLLFYISNDRQCHPYSVSVNWTFF